MKKDKLVIFDFDGVVVDSVLAMLDGLRHSYPGLTKDVFVEASAQPIKERNEAIEKEFPYQDPRTSTQSFEEYAKEKMERSPIHHGMEKVIEDLSESYYIALNTNAREMTCIPILEKYGIKDYFDQVELGGDGRSKVEKTNVILENLGVSADDALFITDTTGDVVDAIESKVSAIGVTWGVHDKTYFEAEGVREGVVGIVDSSEGLYDAISRHFK